MTDAQDTAEAKKVLLAQARKLKMEVDGRWSVETLAEKVQEAIEAAAEQEQAAIAEASDTWIYCIRDCFVGTEKHPAGTVAKAPKDLYQRFKAVGAARLADEDEVQGA
jgi:hypothetical protein